MVDFFSRRAERYVTDRIADLLTLRRLALSDLPEGEPC